MKTIEVKTADLIGPALDWAVAKVERVTVSEASWKYQLDVLGCIVTPQKRELRYSADWALGGPLIEKFHVQTSFNGCGFSRSPTGEHWCAYACKDSGEELRPSGSGPTPLIAACRAIVAAKLGDMVSVPAELVGGAV